MAKTLREATVPLDKAMKGKLISGTRSSAMRCAPIAALFLI